MTPPARADVAVVGGGVMGACIAWQLAARDARVVLLERAHVCAGTTRHSTAIIRLHYTQPLLVRMAAHGLDTYRAFADLVGTSAGFVRCGMLFCVDERERELLERNVAVGRAEGAVTEMVEADDLRAIEPRIYPGDSVFCFEPDAGYCDPYLVTAGYVAAARTLGAAVHEGVVVRSVADGRVETDSRRVDADAVVVAAGPWSAALLTPLGYRLELRAARAEVGRYRLPESFGSPPPALADFSAAQLYFRPAEAGYLEVGSLDPAHVERPVDPDACPEGAERATLAGYEAGLTRRLPAAAGGHWRGAWSGIYDVTADWEPAIGAVPGTERVFVAAGFSGHGFKLAPAVGLSVAELVLDGQATTFDLTLLDPLRFERGELVGARYGYSVLG